MGWVCHNLYEPVACKHEHLFSNQIAMLVWESQPLQNLLPTPTPSFYTIIKQSSGQAACWLFRYYGQSGSIFCPSFTMCKKTFLRPKNSFCIHECFVWPSSLRKKKLVTIFWKFCTPFVGLIPFENTDLSKPFFWIAGGHLQGSWGVLETLIPLERQHL